MADNSIEFTLNNIEYIARKQITKNGYEIIHKKDGNNLLGKRKQIVRDCGIEAPTEQYINTHKSIKFLIDSLNEMKTKNSDIFYFDEKKYLFEKKLEESTHLCFNGEYLTIKKI